MVRGLLEQDLAVLPMGGTAVCASVHMPGLLGWPAPVKLLLDMPTLTSIFSGNISNWSHPDLRRLNPNVAALLPNVPIVRVARADSSGTSEAFIAALHASADGTTSFTAGDGDKQVDWERSSVPYDHDPGSYHGYA